MNPETKLEKHFRASVRQAGGRSIKLAPIDAGIPDRLVVLPPGVMYLVELKTASGKLSPVQLHWHAEILKLGVVVYVVAGEEQVVPWIRWALEEAYQTGEAQAAIEKRRKQMKFE